MKNEDIKKALNPIVNANSRILILGSLPSDKSIIQNEYYGNKNNQFWDIISMVFENEKIKFKDYNEKIKFLNKHCIALWDVYSVAERNGSLDTNIKNGKFNNIKEFLNEHKEIKKVLINGKKAEKGFKEYLKKENKYCDYRNVTSSSSANTRYTIVEKVEIWKEAILG